MSSSASGQWPKTLIIGLLGCGFLYMYSLWVSVASYHYRHFDPDWEFATGQSFLATYDVLFTFLPITLVVSTVVLLCVRFRYGVVAAVFANVIIATNAVAPAIEGRRQLVAADIEPERFPPLAIAIAALAVASLVLLVIGERRRMTELKAQGSQ